jgi:hypothetical protein
MILLIPALSRFAQCVLVTELLNPEAWTSWD